jgi:hypothetical protein
VNIDARSPRTITRRVKRVLRGISRAVVGTVASAAGMIARMHGSVDTPARHRLLPARIPMDVALAIGIGELQLRLSRLPSRCRLNGAI